MVDVRAWPIVHQGVCEHQVYISLKLERVRDETVLDPRLDGLQVHGPLHYVVIVRRLCLADGVVEDIAVTMLRYLRMQHSDHVLEPF